MKKLFRTYSQLCQAMIYLQIYKLAWLLEWKTQISCVTLTLFSSWKNIPHKNSCYFPLIKPLQSKFTFQRPIQHNLYGAVHAIPTCLHRHYRCSRGVTSAYPTHANQCLRLFLHIGRLFLSNIANLRIPSHFICSGLIR